jgi:hypothetical protein
MTLEPDEMELAMHRHRLHVWRSEPRSVAEAWAKRRAAGDRDRLRRLIERGVVFREGRRPKADRLLQPPRNLALRPAKRTRKRR